MAGEPRRMARKLEAIWEVEGEGIAVFREEESPGRNWKTWSSILQLQQGVSSRGASSLSSITYLAFVRFPFVRCGIMVWSTRVTGALKDGPLSCIICVTLRRSPGTTAAQAPT